MKRYLLFDSGCSFCTQLAQAIEKEAGGWLEVRSLREVEMQALLDKARPGWSWEPTVLEVEGKAVRAYTGLTMQAQLVARLGPRRVWHVAWLVREVSVPLSEVDWKRRWLLGRIGGLLAVLMLTSRGKGTLSEPWPPAESQSPTQVSPDVVCWGCACCWGTVWEQGCCCAGGCCGGSYDYCWWHLYTGQSSICTCTYYCGAVCTRVRFCSC